MLREESRYRHPSHGTWSPKMELVPTGPRDPDERAKAVLAQEDLHDVVRAAHAEKTRRFGRASSVSIWGVVVLLGVLFARFSLSPIAAITTLAGLLGLVGGHWLWWAVAAKRLHDLLGASDFNACRIR